MKENKRLTMADVAVKLGVNKSTVSRALRGDPLVNEKTRERVEKLAAELGYRPDPTLSALSQERWQNRNRAMTGNWAVLSSVSEQTLRVGDYASLFRMAERRGYELTHVPLSLKGGAKLVNRMLRARGVRGVFLLPVGDEALASDFEWDRLKWDNYSWLAVRESRYSSRIHRVLHNPFRETLIALEKIADHGFKRIAFLREPTLLSRVNVRQQAAALQFAAGHPNREVLDFEIEDTGLFKPEKTTPLPDALILGYSGLRSIVPEEWQKLPWASLAIMDPKSPLAGIHHDLDVLLGEAVDFLDFQCRRREVGIPARRKTILVDSEWIEGETLTPMADE